MVTHKYSKNNLKEENTARAVGRSLQISTKQAIEICNFIRNKPVQTAKNMLNRVLAKEMAVPFKRFTAAGHKRGHMASGKYPEKCTTAILQLLDSVESNAQYKGLNAENLVISHLCVHKGANQWHYGRLRRRKVKVTHVEIIVQEAEKKQEKPKKQGVK